MTGTSSSSSSSSTETISKDPPSDYVSAVKGFFADIGIYATLPQNSLSKDFYSDLICDLLKADNVLRGRVSCVFPVLPVVGVRFSPFSFLRKKSSRNGTEAYLFLFAVFILFQNYYNGLHGGAVGAIAERVSIACARTVVAGDKELFLGELSISYLSAAALNVSFPIGVL